jgi:hypothetical protein
MKARAIEIILRNEAGGAQLTGIVENQQSEDYGEVDGRDCLIISVSSPSALWGGVPSVSVTDVT